MPETYDRCLGPALFAPFAAELAGRVTALAPQRVLELAAGTGIATAALVRALPTADIIATDLNPAMVSWGSARVPGASWLRADAQSLEFPDGSFELVVCQFGVMFFPDKVAAFAEAARVLVSGERMIFTVWDVVAASPFAAALVDSVTAVLPSNPPGFVVRVPHGYADPDQVRRDVEAGGLRVDAIDRLVLPGKAPSAHVLAEGFCLGTPLRFALDRRGPLDELTRSVGDEMTARLGDGAVAGSLAAYVVTARRDW